MEHPNQYQSQTLVLDLLCHRVCCFHIAICNLTFTYLRFFSGHRALLAKQLSDRLFFQFSGGAIPDAAAIYAARKRREAAREGKTGSASPAAPAASKDYLPINKKQRWDQSVHWDR